MKCIFLILLCVFFPRFECRSEPSDSFFVARQDSEEAICIQPSDGDYFPFPTFNLDKLQFPAEVGIKNWNWLNDWQLQNDTNVQIGGPSQVLIAGNEPFHFVARDHRGTAFVLLLASNLTLWMAEENEPRGAGMLFELDHFNEKTNLKDTTLKYCDQNPEVEGATCTTLDYKNGTNLLTDGNRWTLFTIKFQENRTGVELFEGNYREDKSIVQWKWNNANISNPFASQKFYSVFAKSHQRNAAIYYYGAEDHYQLDLANNKEMKRKYTKRSSGEFCVKVYWNEGRSNGSNELMEVKNLASRGVEPATHGDYWTYFQWNRLDAGEYEFTLRFDQRQAAFINLCQDDEKKIVKTWTSMPKAITKCQFRVSKFDEYSAGPSSPADPTLKTKWTLKDWAYVCDQLGIGSNDPEVPIEFCNLNGCNFSKCPHLQE